MRKFLQRSRSFGVTFGLSDDLTNLHFEYFTVISRLVQIEEILSRPGSPLSPQRHAT